MLKSTGSVDILRVYKSCFVIFNFPIRSILRRFRPISGRNFEHLANGLGSIWTTCGGEMTWEMSLYSIVFLESLKLLEMSFTRISRMKLEQDRFAPITENSIDWRLLQCTGYLFPQAQREVEGLGVKKQKNAIEIQYLYIYMCISKYFLLYNI